MTANQAYAKTVRVFSDLNFGDLKAILLLHATQAANARNRKR